MTNFQEREQDIYDGQCLALIINDYLCQDTLDKDRHNAVCLLTGKLHSIMDRIAKSYEEAFYDKGGRA
jgi:hypothetical protein